MQSPHEAPILGAPTQADPEAGPPALGLWIVLALGLGAAAAWVGPGEAVTRPPSEATFELDRDLPKAAVTVQAGAGQKPCTWQAGDGRFRCGPEYWAFVGPYAGSSAGKARRCTWAHPVGPGATTVLSWPHQALGESVTASLGLVDEAGPGAQVHMRVFIDKERLLDLQTSDSRELAAVSQRLAPGPGIADLRIELTTTDHTLRMACIDLRMTGRQPVPESPAAVGDQP